MRLPRITPPLSTGSLSSHSSPSSNPSAGAVSSQCVSTAAGARSTASGLTLRLPSVSRSMPSSSSAFFAVPLSTTTQPACGSI